MHLVTRVVAYAWAGIGAVFAGASLTGASALAGLRNSLVADGTIAAPVFLFAIISIAYAAVSIRLAVNRKRREEALILAEKPGLARDKAKLKRERRIRAKEERIRYQETRQLKKERNAVRKENNAARREDQAERKREHLETKLEDLREKRTTRR